MTDVTSGSIAEQAGVLKFDVFVKLDSGAIGDKWRFRTRIMNALERDKFTLEIIRGGKRRTLTVKPKQ